jgi:large subunit ribosomal protein L24
MQKLKVGDVVQVVAGAERSIKDAAKKRGKILTIDREAGRVKVEGLRLVKRHVRKGRDRNSPEGGIIEKPGSIALSAVQVVCTKCDRPVRVGFRVEGDKKVRFCKACEARIDA